jgi:spore germination protein YaaH
MLRHILWCCIATVLFLSPAHAKGLNAWAYLGWWMPEGWQNVPLDQFERILFFDMKIGHDGNIQERHGWPEQWVDLRNAAKISNTPVDICVTLLDSHSFQQLFNSPASVRRLTTQLIELAQQEEVSGVHLDFEAYEAVDAVPIQAFRDFVRDVSIQIRTKVPKKQISAFIPIGGRTSLYDSISVAALDRVVLQGYDAHWKEGRNAGPVAPLDGPYQLTWKKAVAIGKDLGVAADRLLLSFPLYGYEWRVKDAGLRSVVVGVGVSSTFARMPKPLGPAFPISVEEQVLRYGASYDVESGSAYYQYRNNRGQFIQGWFDDWWTLMRKTDFLVKEQLGGIAFFMLGYDEGQLVNQFFYRRGLGAH